MRASQPTKLRRLRVRLRTKTASHRRFTGDECFNPRSYAAYESGFELKPPVIDVFLVMSVACASHIRVSGRG